MAITPIDVEVARNLIPHAKEIVSTALSAALKDHFDIDYTVDIPKDFTAPKADCGDLAFQCFTLVKPLKAKEDLFKAKHPKNSPVTPVTIAEFMQFALQQYIDDENSQQLRINGKSLVKDMNVVSGYLNLNLSLGFHGQLLTSVIFGQYLKATPDVSKDRVMIEYSQPNTHKAFHVGHMRNAALGDCLTRIYEQCGHSVTPVNYFGDEGAHVAKCLWYLQSYYLPKAQKAFEQGLKFDPSDPDSVYPIESIEKLEDAIPVAARAEFLGELYTQAVNLLDLSLYTDMAWPQVVAAKVISSKPHPDGTAPANWNVLEVDYGKDTPATVVCGGVGYKVGDLVAYLPVGAKLNKKMGIITPKDMKGIESSGVVLAYTELEESITLTPEQINEYRTLLSPKPVSTPEPITDPVAPQKGKKGSNKGKAIELSPEVIMTKVIRTLPETFIVGVNLAENAKLPQYKDVSVMKIFNELKKESADVLLKLEHQDPFQVALWKRTGQWSLDEFHRIYDWLGCRFDHDFTESEVSEPSRLIVKDMLEKGLLVKKDGAVVCDLTEYNLGYCILLKSDGAGLYATKDLALAHRKFDQYKIEKSIYVVDSAQSFHFAQVFKTLELTGYPQAKKCVHLPYGVVTLPSGRMSSRKGNVLLFSQLRNTLQTVLQQKYGQEQPLSQEVVRRIAVAAIRYGMLNHDTAKDIVFDIEKWTNNTGNTGPYLLYAYSRIVSILTLREVAETNKFDLGAVLKELDCSVEGYTQTCPLSGVTTVNWETWFTTPGGQKFLSLVDFDKFLTEKTERVAVSNFYKFWPTMFHTLETNNPSPVCDYVFSVAQSFSAWYEQVRLRNLASEQVPTKVVFLIAIKTLINSLVNVLGFNTLERM
jgi:arginyl-tRNA synthetase/tRNA-binding EMAP/Myf-like protein